MNNTPHELSIWQDIREEGSAFFSEHKLAILSSNTMDSPYKAYNATLKEKINGQRDLVFSIAYKIFNEETKQLEDNPLFNLIKNENVIKLRRGKPYEFTGESASDIEAFLLEKDKDDKWLDFFVKSIDKDSSTYIATVTATEAYITELGRNGWSLLLNEELDNNLGTLNHLGNKILENTDWEVDDNSYRPVENTVSPIVKVTGSSQTYTIINYINGNKIENVPLSSLRFFYNDVEWIEGSSNWTFKQLKEYQVLYDENDFANVLIDENNLIVDDNYDKNYILDGAAPSGNININIQHINGRKIVKAQITKIEPVLNEVVNVYTDLNGNEVYGYNKTEYIVSEIAQDYLANTNNFTSNDNWFDNSDMAKGANPEPVILPLITKEEKLNPESFQPKDHNFYLALNSGTTYYNIGPRYNRLEVIEDEEYRVQFEVANIEGAPLDSVGLKVKLENKEGSGWVDLTEEASTFQKQDSIFYCTLKANKSTKLGNSQYIRLAITPTNNTIYLKSIHLIREFGQLYGEVVEAEAITLPVYYKVTEDKEIEYLSSDNIYLPKYTEGFEPIRTIQVEKSNYFNALQSLAEIFNVWVGFKVEHYVDGRVVIENGKRVKKVIFSQFSPHDKENNLGFKYGINIKSIQRTVNSDSITTKTIVQDGQQEWAKDGICSITRAHENPSGENFIYNFDYFVAQGFIDYNTLLKDFYGTVSSDFRYYPKISNINKKINALTNDIVDADNGYKQWQAQVDYYQAAYDNAVVAESTKNEEITAWTAAGGDLAGIQDIVEAAFILKTQVQSYDTLLKSAKILADENKQKYDNLIEEEQNLIDQKKELNKQLYERYSRFIQEGTWTDNTYIDDDRYFYDAQTISQISAFPRVTYKINVIDLEGSDEQGLAQYKYRIGERTFMEDEEFFGYDYITVGNDDTRSAVTNIKTPKKVNIIVSETSTNFDNESQNTITVQTYKNQYDELFQQIQATTQTLQYQQGAYNRAANAVEPDGSINVESLQSAFLNNAITLAEASMGGININTETGIEITDPTKANQVVKIIPAGLFVSSDGGQHWTAGITGTGINASLITTGTLNAGNINIVSGKINYLIGQILVLPLLDMKQLMEYLLLILINMLNLISMESIQLTEFQTAMFLLKIILKMIAIRKRKKLNISSSILLSL